MNSSNLAPIDSLRPPDPPDDGYGRPPAFAAMDASAFAGIQGDADSAAPVGAPDAQPVPGPDAILLVPATESA